eukprot:scaffold2164_cov106-Cylindrotheca_fusiformis.AAC.9
METVVHLIGCRNRVSGTSSTTRQLQLLLWSRGIVVLTLFLANVATGLVVVPTNTPATPHPSSSTEAERQEYASRWEEWIVAEYQERAKEWQKQRQHWSKQRLEQAGLCIFDAYAEIDSELLGEKIIRLIVGSTINNVQDHYTRGDVLILTSTAITTSSKRRQRRGFAKRQGLHPSPPRECVVMDVGENWLSVGIGPTWWPKGLYESRKHHHYSSNNDDLFSIQVDRAAAPQAPLLAQRKALEHVRQGTTGSVVDILIEPIPERANQLASELPPRFFPNTNNSNNNTTRTKSAIDQGAAATITRTHNDSSSNNSNFTPNQSQKDAIAWALNRRMSLIRGPPGTGKTRTAALLIAQALGSNNNTRGVLAVTHSNGAADVLLEALLQLGVPAVRFGRPASVSPHVQHRTVLAMAEQMPEMVRLRQSIPERNQKTFLQQEGSAASLREMQQAILESAPVVVTTCIGAHQLHNLHFPLVVLDEAAQTTEPALLCALAASQAEQLVLVGDTKQLPPTVVVATPLQKNYRKNHLGRSPMARLEENGMEVRTLQVQYRMAPALLEFPSNYFYKGIIRSAKTHNKNDEKLPAGFPWPNRKQPLAFLQVTTSSNEEIEHHLEGGRSNPTEAQWVARIVTSLLVTRETDAKDIAVITPYSKQVQLIRTELADSCRFGQGMEKKKKKSIQHVRVGTVDSFQGQEREIVIFSAVRSNSRKELGFLRDSRRLCVAITRAKQGLILIGDPSTLQSCRHWAALLASCEERNCILQTDDQLEAYLSKKSNDESISNRLPTPTTEKKKDPEMDDIIDRLGWEDEYGLF